MSEISVQPIRVEKLEEKTRESGLILAQSSSISITSSPDYQSAGDLLKTIKGKMDILNQQRISITKPLDEAKKKIMNLFRVPLDYYGKAEITIKTAMMDYSRRIEREKKEKEQKIREEQERRAKELERQAKKVKDGARSAELLRQADAERTTIIVPAIQIPKINGVKITTRWIYEITDLSLLPKEFMIPDDKKLSALARSTKKTFLIPGVKFLEVSGIASGKE